MFASVSRTYRGLYLLALFIVLPACQAARIPLPDDLAAGERWAVKGRQGLKLRETLRFGPYEAAGVHRSWTRGRDRGSDVVESRERRQYYSFALREGGVDTWLVKCETAHEKGTIRTPIVDLDLRNRSSLSCALTEAAGSETWLLTLAEDRERPLEGRLYSESDTSMFTIRGTSNLQKSLPGASTSGYYITSSDGAMAAVEVVNSGSVTLHPSLVSEKRALLSAASAALLLLEELRTDAEA